MKKVVLLAALLGGFSFSGMATGTKANNSFAPKKITSSLKLSSATGTNLSPSKKADEVCLEFCLQCNDAILICGSDYNDVFKKAIKLNELMCES